MVKKLLHLIIRRLKQKRDEAMARVNHQGVMTGVCHEVEITPGYLLMLSLANLIALSGLVVNSAPVIIGAMLISPLMGPILSTGFAFVTGNMTIWRRALKKISISVALTLVVAAVASYLSPLQNLTPEILARIRPNLYDLLIAIFAGLAGAVAICTKKSYVTIVPGVAIATAVIPPLSVAGFGIGVSNYGVMAGGFFLFFTNFVAIIVSTCVVLYFYGFTPVAHSGLDTPSLKKRVVFLASILVLICIPLIYTLQRSVAELRLKKNIETALRGRFDRPGVSRLASFTQIQGAGSVIDVSAVINTTRYLSDKEISVAEQGIRKALERPVDFYLEQIKVQPGGLKEEPSIKPTIAPPPVKQRQPAEMVGDARTELLLVIQGAVDKINRLVSPSVVADFTVGFPSRGVSVILALDIRRDYPFSSDELRMLERVTGGETGVPVRLEVRTVPFIPPLVFPAGGVTISRDMEISLLAAKLVFAKDPAMTITVNSYPESFSRRNGSRLAAGKRAKSVVSYLKDTCGIPEERITTVFNPPLKSGKPTVTVSILPAESSRQ